MRQFPNNMFNPQLLRKFPPQVRQGMNPPVVMNRPPEFEGVDPNARREYFGDRLYAKIASNPKFATFQDLFPKIIGIFLDLSDPYIERLMVDDEYFTIQVNEAVKLLRDGGNN